MTTTVDITVSTDSDDETRMSITVERPRELQAVLDAVTTLLLPYGSLLRLQRAQLNHLASALVDVAADPNPATVKAAAQADGSREDTL